MTSIGRGLRVMNDQPRRTRRATARNDSGRAARYLTGKPFATARLGGKPMKRNMIACAIALVVALPVLAQTAREAIAQGELNLETQALQVLSAAETAGA